MDKSRNIADLEYKIAEMTKAFLERYCQWSENEWKQVEAQGIILNVSKGITLITNELNLKLSDKKTPEEVFLFIYDWIEASYIILNGYETNALPEQITTRILLDI
jgi:hypothetical protein